MPTERLATDMQVATAARSLTFTRFLAAPPERVWRAWTDPHELALWWGPKDFTNPVSEADAQPGGSYRIVMRSPEGGRYPTAGRYLEVDPPSRLVFTDDVSDEMPAEWRTTLDRNRPSMPPGSPLRMVVTVTFDEVDGGTRLTIRTAFDSDVDRDAIMAMGAVDGWTESLERLEALVTAR